jgi:hypothetical protein
MPEEQKDIDRGEYVFFRATIGPGVFLRDRPLNLANQPQATDAIRYDRPISSES